MDQENKTGAAMDLGNLDTVKTSNEGAEVELYHPGTNATLTPPVKIRVLGRDADKFRKIAAEQAKKRIAKMSKGGQFKMNAISPEEVEADSIALLAACTLGWDGVVLDGEPLLFSRENAAMLYTRLPWVREQIDAAVGDRALFTKD